MGINNKKTVEKPLISRRNFSLAIWTSPIVAAVVLPSHAQSSLSCPQFFENTNWYETTPEVPLSQLGQIRILLTIRNDTTDNFDVVDQFQLWTIPSVINAPTLPVTTNSITTGIVAPNETISYDLSVDVSGLPDTEVAFGFRGRDNNLFGNIRPNIASIVSSNNECG